MPSGSKLNLGDYSLTISGSGTITDNGANVTPPIKVTQSGAVKGFYPSIQSAVNNVNPGSSNYVNLGSYHFSESFEMRSGWHVVGTGSGNGESRVNKVTYDTLSASTSLCDVRVKMGIELDDCSGTHTIEDVVVSDHLPGANRGIDVHDSNVYLDNVKMSGFYEGVQFSGSCYSTLEYGEYEDMDDWGLEMLG